MFDNKQRFIIENYNRQSTFASFLPGISGVYGTPIWNFYVNRGQAIASFGAENKDHSIMEFYPAHQSYQYTKTMGFRTFMKIDGVFYEPFRSDDAKTKMYIGMNELEIEERNEELGFQINVLYYTLPNEKLGGLVRTVTVKNLKGGTRKIELLDGMPALLPYGITQHDMKMTAQTMKAWMHVNDAAERLPFYQVPVTTSDSAEVAQVEAGNFMVAVNESGERLPVIGDPEVIFCYDTAYDKPVAFLDTTVAELAKREQLTANMVPCAFACIDETLADSMTFYMIIGQAGSKTIFHEFADSGLGKAYFDKKYEENIALIDELGNKIFTGTDDAVFDAYCKQTYVDNVLRGGYPVPIGDDKVFYVYSRKHGDLERDYNFFSMLPEYFSQGNGNYRDVNQNRRSDVYFSPFVKDYNIKVFYDLIQLDGCNPLLVKQVSYSMKNPDAVLKHVTEDAGKAALTAFFEKPFMPGKLFVLLDAQGIKLDVDEKEFLNVVINNSEENLNADFGEGYWSDHWTYNLDLVEAYLNVYPEDCERLLFDDDTYTYYESKAVVLPRSARYVKTKNGARQYRSVDEERKADVKHDKARCQYGKGEIYRSNLLTKLMFLNITKFAVLDLQGMGVEMEGGKPGWYDALNGLPGLFGSSMCETYELQRQMLFTKDALTKYPREVKLPVELFTLMTELGKTMDTYAAEKKDRLWVWNQMNIAKEAYRESITFGIDGREETVAAADIVKLLDAWIAYVDEGIRLACDRTDGIAPAYFAYTMRDYTEENGVFTPVDFAVMDLPLFLEGPVRYLKLPNTPDAKRVLYDKVKKSGMYDEKLSMYKVNASLMDATFELGRCRAFSPGWLENESIWLHMEYKYLLELIKSGLYKEFFEDWHKAGVPFLSYETYGRSPLENSSFIVSSANANAKIHGKGYVARLSGSTAEFLQIWQLMFAGDKLFRMENGALSLELAPAIPAYLVPENGDVACNLFGDTAVCYHCGTKKDIIPESYRIRNYALTYRDGRTETVDGAALTGETAEAVRDGQVAKIDVTIE